MRLTASQKTTASPFGHREGGRKLLLRLSSHSLSGGRTARAEKCGTHPSQGRSSTAHRSRATARRTIASCPRSRRVSASSRFARTCRAPGSETSVSNARVRSSRSSLASASTTLRRVVGKSGLMGPPTSLHRTVPGDVSPALLFAGFRVGDQEIEPFGAVLQLIGDPADETGADAMP